MVKIKNYILITIVAFFFVLLVLAVFLKPDGMYSVTERRSLKQQPEFSLENVLSDTESEEEMVEKISLTQAIEKLTERDALVIKLRYFHGLTQQRIALILNVSQVQVSRIEKKALEKLRRSMETR